MGRVNQEGAAKPTKRSPSNPDAIDDAALAFEIAVSAFKEMFPEAWEQCRCWPTESGLAFIAEKLKG